MSIDTIEFQERIYDLVNGYWSLDNFPVPESQFVKSEFEDGGFCVKAYSKITEAYERLCERLEADEEDEDVEIIINEMNDIMKFVSLKMFQYGVFFARREK